jgi:purine catabolism regulator
MVLTVADVLQLPVVNAGRPEILAGAERLGEAVRWVHVAELKELSGLLEGGELVLTTGLAFEDSAHEATVFLRGLQAAGAAGVVVEITAARQQAAQALREAARNVGLPVVLLSRKVRFVEVTEVVHRKLVATQLEQVEKARRVHEVFTQLSLESAGAEEIVARTAELLAAPVVLEDASHLVLAFDAAGLPTMEVLRDWEARSRLVHYREETVRSGSERWLQTPVGIRGHRWGRLVVPVLQENNDDAESAMVLERAGQALSINRMAERDQLELAHQARAGLVHELRRPGSLTESEALARSAAMGLQPAPLYVPVVFRLDRIPGEEPIGTQRRERALLDLLHRVMATSRNTALAASLQAGSIALLLPVPAKQLADPMLERISGEAAESSGELGWTVGVGRGRGELLAAAAAGLDEAAQVAEAASTLTKGAKRFYRSGDVRLRGLLWLLHEDQRVQTFVESELGELLANDDGAGLDLLERYLESGGNKAQLARTGYLSRPTLYARLAKLETQLGVRLDDAESRTSLHVAVLLRKLLNR